MITKRYFNKNIFIGLVLIFGLLMPYNFVRSQGLIYYVATNGNDNNSCSITQPCKTIQKAASILIAGETVLIRGGTYNERIVPTNSGTAGNYITYSAYPGETVIVDGTNINMSSEDGLFYLKDKHYIKIENITIQNSRDMGIYVLGTYSPRTNTTNIILSNLRVLNSNDEAIKVFYGDTILVEKTYTKESVSSGIGIWNSNNVLLDDNTVVNARNAPAGTGHEECISLANVTNFEVKNNEVYYENLQNYLGAVGIDAKISSSHGKIHDNYIHGFYQDGAIYLDAWDAGLNGTESLHDIDIYSNRVEHAGGITVGSERGGIAENINIYNNVVIDASWSGIVLHKAGEGYGGNGLRKNINIFNNTIFRSIGNGGAGIYIHTANIENIVIKNNIVAFDPKWVGQITLADPSVRNQVTVDKNLTWGRTECANDALSCVELNTGTIRADPKFVNSSILDLHLQANSPAINAGLSIPVVNVDLDGNIRPQGVAYDIGAYEVVVVATPTNTLVATSTPTRTPTRTFTLTSTRTPTRTNTFTPTSTRVNTNTPTWTATSTQTSTFTPTFTLTFTSTATFTATNTPSNTFTPTRTPTIIPTNTPTITFTNTSTTTPTNTPTMTPTMTFTHTPTPTRTLECIVVVFSDGSMITVCK